MQTKNGEKALKKLIPAKVENSRSCALPLRVEHVGFRVAGVGVAQDISRPFQHGPQQVPQIHTPADAAPQNQADA